MIFVKFPDSVSQWGPMGHMLNTNAILLAIKLDRTQHGKIIHFHRWRAALQIFETSDAAPCGERLEYWDTVPPIVTRH